MAQVDAELAARLTPAVLQGVVDQVPESCIADYAPHQPGGTAQATAAGFGVLYGIGSKFFVTREEFQPVQTELKVMSEKIGQIRESVQDTKDGQKELASKMDKILTSVENR